MYDACFAKNQLNMRVYLCSVSQNVLFHQLKKDELYSFSSSPKNSFWMSGFGVFWVIEFSKKTKILFAHKICVFVGCSHEFKQRRYQSYHDVFATI